MKSELNLRDLIGLNSYSLGLSTAAAIFTPVLLPYLVVAFMPVEQKNTYLAAARVIGLAVAMLVQPTAGLFSDRCTSRWGRRRPFITCGALGSVFWILFIGMTLIFAASPADGFLRANFGVSLAYLLLVAGSMGLHFFSNIAQGAQQALIPDLVPEKQRGRASGVKAALELLAVILVLLAGPLVDRGQILAVTGIIAAGYMLTLLVTDLLVAETPLRERPAGGVREPVLRLAALTVIFVGISQAGIGLVNFSGSQLTGLGAPPALKVGLLGLAGLAAMAGSILVGVYLGAWVGIGAEARRQRSFIWWVINRLLFLAAIGSIQGFTQYYLRDVIHSANPASSTAQLLTVVGLFLIPSAVGGGLLADRHGRKRMVQLSGYTAAAGALVLLFARSPAWVTLSGAILGLATGVFMATNWALGTDLVPPLEAGRYLGISNLAGAGAGIVGAGIGGPMADFFNQLNPGLGYEVIFSIYGLLFLFSALVLSRIREPEK